MNTVKIELAESHDVASRGVSVSVDISKLSPEIIAELAMHGLTQKVADAASQAKSVAEESGETIEAVTESMMQKAIDGLYAGEWSRRTGGGGVDEFTRVARQLMRKAIKAKVGAKSPEWKAFDGLDAAEQNAKLDANIEANMAALKPEVDAEIKRRADARKAKEKAASAIDISL